MREAAFLLEAEGLVVVLCSSVAPVGSPALPTGLLAALDGLQRILEDAGVRGLIVPLGLPRSSIRTQDVVEAEFTRRGDPDCFGYALMVSGADHGCVTCSLEQDYDNLLST